MWDGFVRLKTTLKDWRTVILVPIYQSGNRTIPSSYRRITLVSHISKVIESVIATAIREHHKFNSAQLGFCIGTETETAIVIHIANSETMRLTANPVLNSAHNQVSRQKLYNVIASRTIPADIKSAIKFTLQPIEIRTQGDATGCTGIIGKGASHGSPLSPTICIIYMDTLPAKFRTEQLEAAGTGSASSKVVRAKWGTTMFANDVKIQASNPPTIKPVLNHPADWAENHGLTWSTSKR